MVACGFIAENEDRLMGADVALAEADEEDTTAFLSPLALALALELAEALAVAAALEAAADDELTGTLTCV